MSVDYNAGIAYGIYLNNDTLYEGLEYIFKNIHSKEDVPDYWFETEEEFQDWYENESYSELKELLYNDDILINLDGYCDSAGYILGYTLDSVEWGAKPLETRLLMDTAPLMEKKIAAWYQKLFPDKEVPAPQLLLYSQVF